MFEEEFGFYKIRVRDVKALEKWIAIVRLEETRVAKHNILNCFVPIRFIPRERVICLRGLGIGSRCDIAAG